MNNVLLSLCLLCSQLRVQPIEPSYSTPAGPYKPCILNIDIIPVAAATALSPLPRVLVVAWAWGCLSITGTASIATAATQLRANNCGCCIGRRLLDMLVAHETIRKLCLCLVVAGSRVPVDGVNLKGDFGYE